MLGSPILDVLVLLGVVMAVIGGWWLRRRMVSTEARLALPQTIEPVAVALELASRILVGRNADQPAFEIALMGDEDAFNRAAALPNNGRLGLASRLSACLQAAPSVLVQQANQGRHLMEVVINNPLANAVDGKHFLPFARGADGKIIEQAKLLNAEGLSSLGNAAAVWQVASVVVAQKHLADISAKLDEIKLEIAALKDALQDLLDGGVEGTYLYLSDVAKTFQIGEVPKFARVELESCRRGLLQTESALIKRFERRVAQQIEHKETVGTGDLLTETMTRYDELDQITFSLMTCFKTEALAWHVLSMFSGEEATAQVWKEGTLERMANFSSLQAKILETAKADAGRFQSWFNWGSTLHQRRTGVQERANTAVGKIELSVADCRVGMTQASQLLEHKNDAIRLGVEIVKGEIQQVRVLA